MLKEVAVVEKAGAVVGAALGAGVACMDVWWGGSVVDAAACLAAWLSVEEDGAVLGTV